MTIQQSTGHQAITLRGVAGPESLGVELALEQRAAGGGWEPTRAGEALCAFLDAYAVPRPQRQPQPPRTREVCQATDALVQAVRAFLANEALEAAEVYPQRRDYRDYQNEFKRTSEWLRDALAAYDTALRVEEAK